MLKIKQKEVFRLLAVATIEEEIIMMTMIEVEVEDLNDHLDTVILMKKEALRIVTEIEMVIDIPHVINIIVDIIIEIVIEIANGHGENRDQNVNEKIQSNMKHTLLH
jgi:hypothetical protein